MSEINRKVFFDEVRRWFGKLKQGQVNGFNFILDEWEETGFADYRWLAYALATTYHETAKTMQPIREYGRGRGRRYARKDPQTGHVYYGRGYVQLTWRENYETAGRALGINFVQYPDLVMNPGNAAHIMFTGMKEGWFTGKSFSHYINDKQRDYWNARRIINGTDMAGTIANYAIRFDEALQKAYNAPSEPEAPTPPETGESLLVRLLKAIWRLFR